MKILNDEKLSNFELHSKIISNKKIVDDCNVFEKINNFNSYNSKNINFKESRSGELYIYYPLNVLVKKSIKYNSLHELIDEIRKAYKKIYNEENITMNKTIKNNSSLLNRGTSNGKYGIWGHDIDDLYISSIVIYENGIIDLGIDS